jgi:hypothetical protein
MTHSSNQCTVLEFIDGKDTAEGRTNASPAIARSRQNQYETQTC